MAFSRKFHGVQNGYRSGLEEKVAEELKGKGVGFKFESFKVPFEKPATICRYTPDFLLLSNGIIIETKGRFTTADRKKHLLIQEQHPELDIRFVFSSSKGRISKKSQTTYAMWCEKNGFLYADRSIPDEWLTEETQNDRRSLQS